MLQQVNIDTNVLSEPIKVLLDDLMIKHNKLQYCLTVSAKQDANNPEFWTLIFRDPRFDEKEVGAVGTVRWAWGSRNDKEYVTTSRKIQNDRFHAWNRDEHRSKRSKDPKKAIKHILEFVKPFEWIELVAEERNNALKAHANWRDESDGLQWMFRPGANEVAEELQHLLSLGVTFKTEAFKRMVEKFPEWQENQRRKSIQPKADSIMFRDDKVIYITHDGQQQELANVDTLPEKHRDAIALLKIMGDEQIIPEVGYKGKHQKYFVYV
jgi:hypothetical protein